MKHEIIRTRPLVAADAQALEAFYDGLGALTVHARFFVDVLENLDEAGLGADVDQETHLAVVAERIDRDGTEIVGVARNVVSSGDDEMAEFAAVVTDRWQGRGIGTLLVTRIGRDALQRGIRRWRVIRLVGNDRVEGLVAKVAVRESSDESGGVVDSGFRLVPALIGGRPRPPAGVFITDR